MEITTFLAQFWGPVLLLVGIGVFVSRGFYQRVYRDLEKGPLAVLLFGMVAITVGIAHVGAHNIWGTFPEIVISLLGWGLLVKGGVLVVMPGSVDRWGDRVAGSSLLTVAGVALLALGGYLTWLAYLAV